MSGREIGVAAGLVIVAIGAISEADNQSHPAPKVVHVAPKPTPTHTVIVHEVTTHLVTRVVSSSPVAGWEIMLMAIAAVVVAGGVVVALHALRRLSLWPSTSMTCS